MENTKVIEQFASLMKQIKIFEKIVESLSDKVSWIKYLQELIENSEMDMNELESSKQIVNKEKLKEIISNFQEQFKTLYNMSEKQMITVKNQLCVAKELDNARLLYLIKKTKNIKKTLSHQILKKKICKDKNILAKNM